MVYRIPKLVLVYGIKITNFFKPGKILPEIEQLAQKLLKFSSAFRDGKDIIKINNDDTICLRFQHEC